jgi:lipid-binding SYLF domain-containing protein
MERELVRAAAAVRAMTGRVASSRPRVPLALLRRCKGIAVLQFAKVGIGFGGRVGTGIVLAKRPVGSGPGTSGSSDCTGSSGGSSSSGSSSSGSGSSSGGSSGNTGDDDVSDDCGWSAPSAILLLGVGGGVQFGAEVGALLLVLWTDAAVAAFSGSQFTLGADVGVALGPVGRAASVSLSSGRLDGPPAAAPTQTAKPRGAEAEGSSSSSSGSGGGSSGPSSSGDGKKICSGDASSSGGASEDATGGGGESVFGRHSAECRSSDEAAAREAGEAARAVEEAQHETAGATRPGQRQGGGGAGAEKAGGGPAGSGAAIFAYAHQQVCAWAHSHEHVFLPTCVAGRLLLEKPSLFTHPFTSVVLRCFSCRAVLCGSVPLTGAFPRTFDVRGCHHRAPARR